MDCFFFQAEDGIRDLVRSRGLGDVYKRQPEACQHVVVDCHHAEGGVADDDGPERKWNVEQALSLIHI